MCQTEEAKIYLQTHTFVVVKVGGHKINLTKEETTNGDIDCLVNAFIVNKL